MAQRKNDYENSDDREPTTERSANDPYDERMYGNVWTRLWLNRDPRGKQYLTFSQHRVYEQDGVSGITKSFRITDLDDVTRGAQWVSGRVSELKERSDRKRSRPAKLSRLGNMR